MVSQMKISDYRDESENRFRSLQVYLQTFNLMIAMLIEMFPEGQNFRNGLDIFSSLSSFTLHTYIRVLRVGSDTSCDHFIQKILQNQPSSTLTRLQIYAKLWRIRYHPRFFDQVGHQTMCAYIENNHFYTKSCHRQTYQNYEQPPQCLQTLYL